VVSRNFSFWIIFIHIQLSQPPVISPFNPAVNSLW
jgi:hypothetical protein